MDAGAHFPQDMNSLFAVETRYERYLHVEATLARVQGEMNIIPRAAATRIQEVARFELLDLDRMRRREQKTNHFMVALVEELSRLAGEPAGRFVHWGVTTQNVQQTGDVLGLRNAHQILVLQLCELLDTLSRLAERTAEVLLPGRTHWQHAVPITFGMKVAGWISSIRRSLERLHQCRPRLLTGMFGGPAGTFAAFGAAGPELQKRICDILGIGSMRVPARNQVDQFLELVTVLGILSCATGSIGDEISRLMGTDFQEVSETLSADDVGSTAMPQKRNAKTSPQVTALGARTRSFVPLAFEASIQSHEVDGARSAMMDVAVKEVCILSAECLYLLERSLDGLEVFPDRMASNLQSTGGLISAEAIMMGLAPSLGRQVAHDVVHEAANRAPSEGKNFADALIEDERVANVFGYSSIQDLLDFRKNAGLSEQIAISESLDARSTAQAFRESYGVARPKEPAGDSPRSA